MNRQAWRATVHGVTKESDRTERVDLLNIPLGVNIYMHHVFFTLSSADRHLSYFHALAIVNSAAVELNIEVYESFQMMVFSR